MSHETDWMEVYVVIDGDQAIGRPDFWQRVGRAFPHRNGEGGFNILLNALPMNGKLVVKPRNLKGDE
jgi:hypothetical protein